MKPPLRTITDHYRSDRADAALDKEPAKAGDRVWRTYMKATFDEINRRSMRRLVGGPLVRWRKAQGDDDLPRPFSPYWRSLSGEELLELYDVLFKARHSSAKLAALTD